MPKKPTTDNSPKETAATEVVVTTTLADLQKLCQKKRRVTFMFEGAQCSLEVRRLTPAEDAKLSEIITAVVPPIDKGPSPEQDRLLVTHPDYLRKKADAEITARALGLYWAVPEIQSGKPGLNDQGAIKAYVQDLFTNEILQVLWRGVTDNGVSLPELVNFT